MADISKWYVVHTYSGYENKVASNIETVVENRKIHDQILEVKVPTETVTEIRDDGTKKEVERKIFPGYVLVKVAVYEDEDSDELQMNDDTWYVIRNTRGVPASWVLRENPFRSPTMRFMLSALRRR